MSRFQHLKNNYIEGLSVTTNGPIRRHATIVIQVIELVQKLD